MVEGMLVLLTADAVLAAAGVYLLRSPRFGDSIPFWGAAGATAGAFTLHLLAYVVCQALAVRVDHLSDGPDDRMILFLANACGGVLPAALFGYLLLRAFTHRLGQNLAMLDKPPAPLSADALIRARSLAERGGYDAALEECRSVARLHPESPLPLLEMAAIHDSAGRPEEAADLLRRVLRSAKKDPDAARRAGMHLANLLETRLGEPEAAALLLRQMGASGSAPDSAVPPSMDGARAKARRGDVDGAVGDYRRMFAARPEEPRPVYEAASLLEKDGRRMEALDVLREVLRRARKGSSTWSETAYRMARLLHQEPEGRESAMLLLREIIHDAGNAEQALQAQRWLRELTQA